MDTNRTLITVNDRQLSADKFDSDEKIEVERASTAGTISNRRLEFAEHPHEI